MVNLLPWEKLVPQTLPTPEALIQRDLERLSDASAHLMETLAKVKPSGILPEDFPLSNLVSSLEETRARIDREIAKASGAFIRHAVPLELLARRGR